jgi:(1->4)-alpha-D-glucan 1-alpha-D-glucosylmutase
MTADAQPLSTTPRATARLQFHRDFTLDDAVALVPYFARLGISHLYASPLLTARPGSTHGYDIVDHNSINPELGGMPALERLIAALRFHHMGLILDIVPNHMGVGGSDNGWWMDVLEWGRASRYAEAFDIDWNPPEPTLRDKVMAPFLGSSYGEALEAGELVLHCDREQGRFFVAYHEHHFPVDMAGCATILGGRPGIFAEAIAHFAGAADLADRPNIARPLAETAKRRLAQALATPGGSSALDAVLKRYDAKTEAGRARLHALLETQHYRLSWWRAAADEINWRRFFDINMLAGVRVETPWVFEESHRLIVDMYASGMIDGVRIDHVDGLADPRGYCRKLRRVLETAGASRPEDAPRGEPYIIIEKILAPHERLRAEWNTSGTTGYDFMNEVGGVLHDAETEAAFTEIWNRHSGRGLDFITEEREARRQILRDNLTSEWNGTAAALHRVAAADLKTRDFTLTGIRRALLEILVHFPVYRIYAGAGGATPADDQMMNWALALAHRSIRAADHGLLDVIRGWLADDPPCKMPPGERRDDRLRAMVRFQQLSSPVAAKSVEDTAFYRFGRLLSRNEVGSTPAQFAVTPAAFHQAAAARGEYVPRAMLATATHDHKRGEDTRMRLATLAEIPADWEAALTRWMRLNAPLVRDLESGRAPSAADEIMLYQTLIAAWPIGLDVNDAEGIKAFADRVYGWWEKSIREAKLRSGWTAPDEAYEAACRAFLAGVLDQSRAARTAGEIAGFAERIGPAGAINGLAQTLLKYTVPGVPDLYQGTEFWDQSLVDPDNRRPVDFTARNAQLEKRESPFALLGAWQSGAVKQALIARVLTLRAEWPGLFAKGDYTPLTAEGKAARHVLAFTRSYQGQRILVAVTRLPMALLGDAAKPLVPGAAWGDMKIILPGEPEVSWRDILSQHDIPAAQSLKLADLLADFPVALLCASVP